MARVKKDITTEEVIKPVSLADCTEYASIAFDRNNNLYGVSKQGTLFKFNWDTKKWEVV